MAAPECNPPLPYRELIVRQIESHSSESGSSFRFLCEKCDADHLSHLLMNIQMTFPLDSQVAFNRNFGYSKKDLEVALATVRSAGRYLDGMRALVLAEFPVVLSDGTITDGRRLPSQLFAVADFLQKAAVQTRKRGRPEYDERLAALVNYVHDCFGQPYHAKVAAVVAAMRGDNYTVAAHKDWVKNHPRLLNFPTSSGPEAVSQ